ncbi:MAG: SRPBCC family protein [Dehalococcoidia bacterium]
MSDFHTVREISINAPLETVFGIISDFARHKELAGRGELVNIRMLTEGPIDFGSIIEADESVQLGDNTIELSTKSVVVGYNSPNNLSWIVVAPFPLRRVQWWFQLTQQGDSTMLVHETEVDLGEAAEQFGGVETFIAGRGADLSTGMQKTLENVKHAAEK